MDVQIPDKLYFKIGEVSRLADVKPYVLRYWESEFPSIRPSKSRSKQRLYRKKDIELILRIKDLLYNQGFTIAGAKKILRQPVVADPPPGVDEQMNLPLDSGHYRSLLEGVRADLEKLRDSLKHPS